MTAPDQDRVLADRVVALGVITNDAFRHDMYSLQSTDGQFVGVRYEANKIVRDWRVAGALMEKVLAEQPQKLDTVMVSYHPSIDCFEASVAFGATNPYGTYLDRSDKEYAPRAIIEACVAAIQSE